MVMLPGGALGRGLANARLAQKQAQVNAAAAAQGARDGFTSVIRDAAAPIEDASNAAMTVSIAIAISVVAVVIAVLYVTRKVL